MARLSHWDYLVIAGYLSGIVIIGLIFFRRQKSLREYFLASGALPWWAVAISMYATELSPISFLGIAGWIFLKDSRFAVGGMLLAAVAAVVAALIWVPLWSRLQIQSIYGYLERRYNPAVRSFGAAIFPTLMIFWVGNGLVAASMSFEAVTDVPAWYCILAIVALGTVYTMLGGARAVIWTDVAQFVVFVFAFVVIGVLLLRYFDWQPMRIYNIASNVISEETHYPHTKIFSAEFSLQVEATIWAIMFMMFFHIFVQGTNQVTMQRLMAAGKRKEMFKGLLGSAGVNVFFVTLVVLVSWGFVAFYHENPVIRATIDHPDQVMAHYVVGHVPNLVRGLIMAGLLAAIMSTFDSALNSMSSVTINDFYRRYFVRHRSEQHYVAISRYFTLGWGVLLLLFALWQLGHSESTVIERVSRLQVLVFGPIVSFFVMGLFSRRVNAGGVLIGGAAGIMVPLAFNGFPGLFERWISYEINFMWLGGLGMLTGFVVSYPASLLFAKPPADKLKGLTIWTKSE